MTFPWMRVFALSPLGTYGNSCDAGGAFMGTVPLLKRSADNLWRPRDHGELSDALGTCFGLPIDFTSKAAGLAALAQALNEDAIAHAQLIMLHLRLPEPSQLVKNASSMECLSGYRRFVFASGTSGERAGGNVT